MFLFRFLLILSGERSALESPTYQGNIKGIQCSLPGQLGLQALAGTPPPLMLKQLAGSLADWPPGWLASWPVAWLVGTVGSLTRHPLAEGKTQTATPHTSQKINHADRLAGSLEDSLVHRQAAHLAARAYLAAGLAS